MGSRWCLGLMGMVLALVSNSACSSRRQPPSRGPEPPPAEAVKPLSMALLGGTSGAVTSNDVFEQMFEAPVVSAAGGRLWDRLSEEPSLEPLFEGFLAGLLAQPALMATLAKMAEGAPDSSIDELSDRAMKRLAQGFDGPVFDAAMDTALDRLLDRPQVDAAFERMAQVMVDRSEFVDRLTTLLQQWRPDLEAAIGVPMTHEDFPERLEAHMQRDGRNEILRELLGQRVLLHPEVLESLAAFIDDEAFFGVCAGLARDVLGSPDVQVSTTQVIVAMIEQADATQVQRRVNDVLVSPPVEHAVVRWADGITASAALVDVAAAVGRAFDDPNLHAELYDVLIGTSGRRTARRSPIDGVPSRRGL